MTNELPKVLVDDDGIRPAGEKNQCLYCRSYVGEPHKIDCVCIHKKVRMKFTIQMDVEVPFGWDEETINFSYNESSWCASNLPDMLKEDMKENKHCMCGVTTAEFVSVTEPGPYGKSREENK